MKVCLLVSFLLAALTHPAIAVEHTGKTLARVCAGDFERLCAKQVAVPAIEDFRDGGTINQCLKEKLRQLSNPCWYLIIEDGR
jgi:hypothetical protein